MCVTIHPTELKPGESCTPEWLDRVISVITRNDIEKAAKEFYKGDLARAVSMCCGRNEFVFSHESSWITEEGRALVRWLLSHYHMRDADSSSEEAYVEETISKRKRDDDQEEKVEQKQVKEETKETSQSPTKKARLEVLSLVDDDDDDDDENVCMICMVNPPNTLVLPCMDCVVCKTCSVKLKATHDARICVKCRRPIESVEEDL
jgi:hypothetical protein